MLQRIKKEFFHILPAFLFFLVTFNMINYSERLMLRHVNYPLFSFWEIFLAVLFISKILLVVDHLPCIHSFSKHPLIYRVIWKTVLYWTITVFIRATIRLSSFLFHNPFTWQSVKEFYENMDWDVFWGVGFFYLMVLFIFVLSRELTMVIGLKKMRQLFFGRIKKCT